MPGRRAQAQHTHLGFRCTNETLLVIVQQRHMLATHGWQPPAHNVAATPAHSKPTPAEEHALPELDMHVRQVYHFLADCTLVASLDTWAHAAPMAPARP